MIDRMIEFLARETGLIAGFGFGFWLLVGERGRGARRGRVACRPIKLVAEAPRAGERVRDFSSQVRVWVEWRMRANQIVFFWGVRVRRHPCPCQDDLCS